MYNDLKAAFFLREQWNMNYKYSFNGNMNSKANNPVNTQTDDDILLNIEIFKTTV